MKLYLSTILLVLSIAFYSHAQIDVGVFHAGISGIPTPTFNGSRSFGVSAKMNFNVCLSKHISIGISPYLSKATEPINESLNQEMRSFGIFLNGRYHFKKNKFLFFGELNLGMGEVQYVFDDISPSFPEIYKGKSYSLMLGPGLSYLLNEEIALEFSIPYLFRENLYTEGRQEVRKELHTIAPTIGIQFFIF